MYFRYSRDLIGGLCRAAYETVKEVTELELRLEDDAEDCVPAMIAAPQSWGNLLTWNIHVHALVPEGAFRKDGEFVPIPHIRIERAIEIWEDDPGESLTRDKVFDLLWEAGRIDHETIGSTRSASACAACEGMEALGVQHPQCRAPGSRRPRRYVMPRNP